MSSLELLLTKFIEVIPRLVGAILILIIGFIIASILSKILYKALSKTGIDKVSAHLKEIDLLQNINIIPSLIIAKTIYYVLILIFLIAASDTLQFTIVSNKIADFIEYIPQLFSAIVMLLAGLWVATMIKNVITTTCRSLNIPSGKLIAGFVFYFLLITLSISSLAQAGIQTNFIENNISIVLGGMALAFAISYGYASRHIASNILSSTYNRKNFHVGYIIKVGDLQGKIVKMDSNSVTLQIDERLIVVPQVLLATKEVEILHT